MNLVELLVSVATLTGILGVVTVALNLQYGRGGMINFGLVAYFAAGAYTYAIITQPPPSGLDQYLVGLDAPSWVGFIGAGAAGVLFAAVTGWPTLRLRGEYLAVTTFAFAEVFHSFIINERRFGNGTVGLVGIDRPLRDVVTFMPYRWFFALAALAFLATVTLLTRRLVRSPYGRLLDAIRDDEVAVQTSGKNTERVRLQVFLVSALLVGLAGAFYVWFTTLATPLLFTAELTFMVWIALILGGEGSILGAVVGTALVILFEEMVSAIPFGTVRSAQIAASFQTSAIGLLLIVFLRWRPGDYLSRLRARSR